MEANNENVIEWISGQDEITCTFTQTKWVNKAKALQEKHPDKVKIVDINKDGSIKKGSSVATKEQFEAKKECE